MNASNRKPSDLLLVVNPRERREAQAYIDGRLKNLDVKQLPRLQELAQASRAHMAALQRERQRLGAPTDPAGRVAAKLYEASLSGMAEIVTGCMRQVRAKVRQLKEMKHRLALRTDAAQPPPNNEEIYAFLIPCSPDEEAHACTTLTDRARQLEVGPLKALRDASQELISWWESEAGQIDALRINQYGDVRLGQGRIVIRGVRDGFRREVFAPLRELYRELDGHYRLKASENAFGE